MQINSYPRLISSILGIDHTNDSERYYNQIPNNNTIFNDYVKQFILNYKGAEVSKDVKDSIKDLKYAKEVTDFRILNTIDKLKTTLFSKDQVDKMLQKVEKLTKKATEKENVVANYLTKNFNLKFLDVTPEEDKLGVDLKDERGHRYQVKSVPNVRYSIDKKWFVIDSKCDMKINDDLDNLVIVNNSKLYMFNYRKIKSIEPKEEFKVMIKYNELVVYDLKK